ncbi:hypothetical protein DFH09DRAFT_1368380 [Mycena vulgaris]|nr:hypothetical protein DFH09DRAFT_1368380 [Mycena vulgaris]
MPPELKLETYYHLDHTDLLSLSHVSKFWRSLVLEDRRWAAWFELIVNPVSGESIRDSLTRLQVLDAISLRAIVTLCFSTKCTLCSKDTPDIFLPLLKRICRDCLDSEEHVVVSLSAALTTYDLSEKEVPDVVVLRWEEPDPEKKRQNPIMARVKLVSASAVKQIAIDKHGGQDNLTAHLQEKKARLRKAYEKRLIEYNAANSARAKLKASGDLTGAAAVTWKNNKRLPKTRPAMPLMLKNPIPPAFYQETCILPTNFLALEDGCLAAQKLLRCFLCVCMAEFRAEDEADEPLYPDFMRPALLPDHEQQEHYARVSHPCARARGVFVRSCDPCSNRAAIAAKAHHDATHHWAQFSIQPTLSESNRTLALALYGPADDR